MGRWAEGHKSATSNMQVNDFIKALADFLLPPQCHICGRDLAPGEDNVCTSCLDELPRSGYQHRQLNPMEERFAGVFPFERATGHFLYSRGTPLAVLIHDMKYRGFPRIGYTLGSTVGRELFPSGFFSDAEVAVPVPMHWFKKARRGYNQVEYIARGIADAAGLEVSTALRALHPHSTQTRLTRSERLQNTSGVFKIKRPAEIAGRHVLLVDDVCTTGATLIAAAEALWESKPSALTILTLGVTF